VSRHARRETQGEQDWGPGPYPPADADGPEPTAPERWERESWDSGDDPPGSGQSWDEPSWDHQQNWAGLPGGHPSGPLSPLPPAGYDWREPGPAPLDPRPGPGAPGGGRRGGPQPEAGYSSPAPAGRRSRHAAQDDGPPDYQDRSQGRPPAAGYRGARTAGYPGEAAGYPGDGAGYPGEAGYPAEPVGYREDPPGHAGRAGYPDAPRRSRRPVGGTGAEPGYPGYEGYVDHPGDVTAGPGDSGAYPAAGLSDSGAYPAARMGEPGAYPPAGLDESGAYPAAGLDESGAYPAAGLDESGAYPAAGLDESGAYPAADSGAYPATGDWYAGAAGQPGWEADDYDRDGLLPGMDERHRDRPPGAGGGSPPRKRRRGGRKVALVLLSVFVIFIAAVGAVGYHYYREYLNPPDFPGAGSGSVVVQIVPGELPSQVGTRLAALGVVASERAFYNAAKSSPQGNSLEPGYFRVRKQMKASLALALLLNPASRVQSKVTIPEGFRLQQIIALLGRDTGNLKGYEQAIADPAALGLPSFANGKPEGYLFPATYELAPKTPPVQVLKSMVAQFEQQAASLGLPAASARAQESQGAVITVASLIEAEGKRPQDYPKIAEVIYNRLNDTPPMHLQLDTTVLYGMNLVHSKAAFSTTFPSPYNTYVHGGLPPGPIDSPGRTAIEAALHPAHGNLLYFLTINSRTGQTLFFTTATAFDQAVARYGSTGNGTGARGAG
jgi:peptidoglycan lytic transglycosylase G